MGTALEKYQERMRQDSDAYSEEEKIEGGGAFISTRGGIFTFKEEELPGNEIVGVIVDSVHENTYYEDRFDEDYIVPPTCFAIGRRSDEMAPHESMEDSDYFEPQADNCEDCPMNEWGSADTGKGKACSNRRRLAILPAGYLVEGEKRNDWDVEIIEDIDHYKVSDMGFLKLPVTSVRNYSKYVKQLQKDFQRPPYGVITRIFIVPDKKTQYKIHFEVIEELPDELLEAIFERNEEAREEIGKPYDPPSDEDQERPKAKAKKGLAKRKSSRRRSRDDE